ncbi:hypothetical protein CERSUDRAFT_120207 [Gelatoporia subvermispora B]|uniref:COP9 signalosome complex subunit 3 n=1 Tax=Ceriporiopsis subvermispora (strain B) TaxID=914234 RepID=M2QYK6_CERS8|nr:hypothetical protein CERSUDRAFT_120207 [Gelatoporia subvermispora B]
MMSSAEPSRTTPSASDPTAAPTTPPDSSSASTSTTPAAAATDRAASIPTTAPAATAAIASAAPPTAPGSVAGASVTATTATAAAADPALDALLTHVRGATPAGQVSALTLASEALLAGALADGSDPLAVGVLTPEVDTLAILFIMSARLHNAQTPDPSLEAIEEFCARFDPEKARLASSRVTMLANGIVRAADSIANPKAAISPLYDLITRYPPTQAHLTVIHPIFLNACVSTRHFTAALPVLATPILNIDTSISDLSYNDHLVYHYAGGLALAALKRWRDAADYFEICATAPAQQIPAAIQLEACKKLVLVHLILYGEAVQLPKYTHAVLVRMLRNSPYWSFAKAYPQQHASLQGIAKNEIFISDKNTGLLNQALERVPRWLIKRLTSTYLTLSLRDIANDIGLDSIDEVREILVDMVASGELGAHISVDGTVTFSDPPSQYSKVDIDRALLHAQAQAKLLQDTERKLAASKEYLTKAVRHKDDPGSWAGDEDLYGPPGGRGDVWADD